MSLPAGAHVTMSTPFPIQKCQKNFLLAHAACTMQCAFAALNCDCSCRASDTKFILLQRLMLISRLVASTMYTPDL